MTGLKMENFHYNVEKMVSTKNCVDQFIYCWVIRFFYYLKLQTNSGLSDIKPNP